MLSKSKLFPGSAFLQILDSAFGSLAENAPAQDVLAPTAAATDRSPPPTPHLDHTSFQDNK
jgi:hypothetical protein